MPKYELTYSEDAKRSFAKYKKSGEKQALKKLRVLLEELEEHPRTGTGKPEQLKWHGEQEIWSRRITDKHRLVYEIQARLPHAHLLSASALKRNLLYYGLLMDIMMMNNLFYNIQTFFNINHQFFLSHQKKQSFFT